MTALTWAGIALCLLQSGLLSGLTLGLFGMSRLRLEVQAEAEDPDALKVLGLRKDAHLLLTSLLWSNVSVNVLLTLLTESVMTGVGAFLFSTAGITFVGEIIPQSYISRHALKAGAVFVPLVKVYMVLFYPVAKPTALLLDLWLGKESPQLFREKEFHVLLRKHVQGNASEISKLEAVGAENFLALDDVAVEDEGEPLHPDSVIALPESGGRPVFPAFERALSDPFLRRVNASGKKWVVITDPGGRPSLVINAPDFLRDALLKDGPADPMARAHRPVVVTEPGTRLGQVIGRLDVQPERKGDDVIDRDLILFWGKQRRIITGADLLGRLLRGIVSDSPPPREPSRGEGRQ
ncbi:MAG: DUF21 domain-containing protein [Elusimicrobiota bacterium]